MNDEREPQPREQDGDGPGAPSGLLERLQAAGAAMDGFDDAVLRATTAVHQMLLASQRARYDGPVDPENWVRLPVAMDVSVGGADESWAVVPWTPAVMSSAVRYLGLLKKICACPALKMFLLVTPEEFSEDEVREIGDRAGTPVVVVNAATLRLTGAPARLRRVGRVTGGPTFEGHGEVSVGRAIAEHNAELGKAEAFHEALWAATPRTWVSPFVLALNVLVFAAMVATGASIFAPSTKSILAWGALHGPNVAHGEWWRLPTANYVHIGIIHIGFNMWCFWQAGRFTERLLGNWAFLIAYTLSGIGGSVASLAHNPLVVGAGASGAVFGVFGSIVGFMLVRRRTIPVLVFKPLISSTLGFIGYNIFFGLTQPSIDNAAHIGGLVTGFLCGVVLSRRVPVPAAGASRMRYVYVLGVAALVAAGGVFAAGRVPVSVEEAYGKFAASADPLVAEYEAILVDCKALLEAPGDSPASRPRLAEQVAELGRRSRANYEKAAQVPCRRKELAGMKRILQQTLAEQVNGLWALEQAAGTENASDFRAFIKHLTAARRLYSRFVLARAVLLKRYGIETGGGKGRSG